MGESRRRKLAEGIATELTKKLTDEGKLIEAGFAAFSHLVMPKDAPEIQRTEMRLAFMAGAEHVFSSMMNILDPGEEPTADDLRRMDLIHAELEQWRDKLKASVAGRALRTLGDAPVEAQYAEKMKAIARAVDEYLNGEQQPKPNGFILMVFPFEGHDGRCNYMSNAQRADVVTMLKHQIKRFEGQPDITGHA